MISKIKYISILLLLFGLAHCTDDMVNTPHIASSNIPQQDTTNNADGTNFSGVMMEGFYMNVPDGGNWWNTIKSKASTLANMDNGYGIDRIWLPPAYKGASGAVSNGYDPYDYYDLGNYNQKGTTETRYGSKQELKSVITTLKNHHIKVMGDIVLNHRTGGALEYNSYTKDSTYTDFSGVKSGKATWHWQQFHPNAVSQSDRGTFGGLPDVCYKCNPVTSNIKTWMNWLKDNIGFDGGWRFDDMKAVDPSVITEMKSATGNAFSIGEYYDQNINKVNTWINQTKTDRTPAAHAFDFPLYFSMASVFTKTDGSGDITKLVNPYTSLSAKRPSKAVTFAANHDTDEIVNDKMLAYAFILTYQGYPCIWWKDYFNYGLATSAGKPGNGINPLVWVRGKLAKGNPQIELIKADNSNMLIYDSRGYSTSNPGYIVAINDQPSGWKTPTINTKNTYLQGQTLHAYAWYSTVQGENKQPEDVQSNSAGNATLSVPPRGYVVYSIDGF